jgi:hypothetical protein
MKTGTESLFTSRRSDATKTIFKTGTLFTMLYYGSLLPLVEVCKLMVLVQALMYNKPFIEIY